MVDVLLTDADIVTMAADSGPARSMLVRDGRIVAVGPAERVYTAAEPGARGGGLEGAAVIPGVVGAHWHLCDVGYLGSGGVGCGLQPAGGTGYSSDRGAVAGRGRRDAGGVVGDRQRVCGVQAAGGAASHPR